MNWVDIIILAVLIGGFVWSFRRGFILELVYFFAFILGLITAFLTYPYLLPLLEGMGSSTVQTTVSFGITFVLGALLVAAAGMLVHNLIREINLGYFDRLLGGIFGLIKVTVVMSVVIVMMTGIQSGEDTETAPDYINNSLVCIPLVTATTHTMEGIPQVFGSFMSHYGRPALKLIQGTENEE